MGLRSVPVTLEEANAFVSANHRHHMPVVGHKFSIAAALAEKIVGVVIVGRPVSRHRDDGLTLEVTRLCTDGAKYPTGKKNRKGEDTFHNPCSFLYGAAARAAFALGYMRIGTYILASESGASLNASGWRLLGERGGGSWSVPSRPRVDTHPLQTKMLFEKEAP